MTGTSFSDRVADRPLLPCCPAGADVPGDRDAEERRNVVQTGPLGRGHRAEADAAGDPPGTPHAHRGPAVRQPGRESFAPVVAVDHQAGERADQPEHHEDVEDAGAAEHELESVESEQHAGQAAEQRGAEHPPRRPGQDQHRERADDGGGDPPAELGMPDPLTVGLDVPEDPFGCGDHPLAERRVDGEEVTAVVLDAVMQQVTGVGRVVDLVEDDALGALDGPHPHDPRDEGDRDRPEPAGKPAAGDRRRQQLRMFDRRDGGVSTGVGRRQRRGHPRQGMTSCWVWWGALLVC